MEKNINNIVLTSRVRLARNIEGLKFPMKGDDENLKKIIKPVYTELSKIDNFNIYNMNVVSSVEAHSLKEQHLISKDLIENPLSGAAIISADKTISVMLNEEDHLRLQCIYKGLNLFEAYKTVNSLDDRLSRTLSFSFDKELGFLTACPTNIGTGMRASVMCFLPALTVDKKIEPIIHSVARERITIRGVYGEGSEGEGCMFQVSNQVSTGLSETDILRHVEATVLKICEAEQTVRQNMLDNNLLDLKDRVRRAYGILTNAVKIDSQEFMKLFSDVKLGYVTGLLKFKFAEPLDEIITKVQPANIMLAAGKQLTSEERDIYRAEFVAKALKSIS